jgi:hypothetical protein
MAESCTRCAGMSSVFGSALVRFIPENAGTSDNRDCMLRTLCGAFTFRGDASIKLTRRRIGEDAVR